MECARSMEQEPRFLLSQAVVLALAALLLASCVSGGFDSVRKVNQLEKGMPYDEVVRLLGPPETTQNGPEGLVAKFWLHQAWKGNVPYDMTFRNSDKTLLYWKEDEKGYAQSQARLGAVAKALESADKSQKSGGGGPMVPNDPQLMQYFAGQYYGYSGGGYGSTGGTERRLTLCANGTYRMNSESSYSGTDGSWGAASQGGKDGQWTIQGNRNQGRISMGGTTYDYSTCGNGCLVINGVKMGYAGQANCN